MTVNIPRLFNRSDHTTLGGKSVKIPKLTPAKFKSMVERIQTLPQIAMSVFAERHSADFIATLIAGGSLAIDEVIGLVAILAEEDPAFIEHNAGIDEMLEFVRLTAEKNDLGAALKNVRAVLAQFRGQGGQ